MSFPRVNSFATAARAEVRAAIGQAAARTGINFQYLVAQAQSESGLDPTAKAQGSTATGLYQFLDQSWLAVVKRHGSKHGMDWAADAITPRPGGGYRVCDPALKQAVMSLREQAGPAALMAGCYAADNAAGLGQALGRPANATDLYFAHFLGLDGARRFLSAAGNTPDANAAALFPREARANRPIFYERDGSARSLSAVYTLMGRKLDRAAGVDAAGPALPANPALAPIAPPPEFAQMRLAYADIDGVPNLPEQGDGVAGLLQATAERARMDVLRPSPAQARLAYLMLAMPTV